MFPEGVPVMAGLAKVAELVDALDLGSSGVTRESSSLSFRTTVERLPHALRWRRQEYACTLRLKTWAPSSAG